ncbi:unnamed protein product [Bursaphelenchus okinawaensis]|uniref:C3H1-type domain-containing protein n=1 Tax=Bursaphelenchus okinawaensis TaxID=465554 RepID=A0A811LRR7_9BILA|nr:unnamed protein product [Bursaphelenchus okinawaensis]CAG9127478.1 unnamed protein product [Bursaphelenchus okinawaensis]
MVSFTELAAKFYSQQYYGQQLYGQQCFDQHYYDQQYQGQQVYGQQFYDQPMIQAVYSLPVNFVNELPKSLNDQASYSTAESCSTRSSPISRSTNSSPTITIDCNSTSNANCSTTNTTDESNTSPKTNFPQTGSVQAPKVPADNLGHDIPIDQLESIILQGLDTNEFQDRYQILDCPSHAANLPRLPIFKQIHKKGQIENHVKKNVQISAKSVFVIKPSDVQKCRRFARNHWCKYGNNCYQSHEQ